MFPRLTNIDTLLLEYDSDRAGDFQPLQHVRPDTTVVLGLLTTKSGELEDDASIKERIAEAAKQVPTANLALSTQCGFASSGQGNPLTVEQQRKKLETVVRVSREVWGS